MYSHTKKVGSVGRYGPRIGRKVRHEIAAIERQRAKPSVCPTCGKAKVIRTHPGIWECRSCQASFTGGAFMPKTKKKRG